MPIVNVFSNVRSSDVDTSQALKELTSAASKTIGKPEQLFEVILNLDTPMAFGGTEQPAAFATVSAIGNIGGEKNKSIAAALSDVVQSRLSVASDRFYIQFNDIRASDIGYKGTTPFA